MNMVNYALLRGVFWIVISATSLQMIPPWSEPCSTFGLAMVLLQRIWGLAMFLFFFCCCIQLKWNGGHMTGSLDIDVFPETSNRERSGKV